VRDKNHIIVVMCACARVRARVCVWDCGVCVIATQLLHRLAFRRKWTYRFLNELPWSFPFGVLEVIPCYFRNFVVETASRSAWLLHISVIFLGHKSLCLTLTFVLRKIYPRYIERRNEVVYREKTIWEFNYWKWGIA